MRFDHYGRSVPGELPRDAFLRAKGLDPREKTILITTVTRGNYKDEPTLLKNLIAERDRGAFPGHPNIFVRIHPKEDNFAEYEEFMRSTNVHVERGGHEMRKNLGSRIELMTDDLVNLKDTLRHADVVVNYASTITLEACVFDRPVVNIGFPPYYMNAYSFTHYQPVVALGAVRIAKSFDELVAMVSLYLREPGRDREGRARAVREFIGHTDGRSYERAVEAISRISSGYKV